MARTFRGGIHPKYNKDRTVSSPIERIPAPKVLVFPLKAHIGAENKPLVNVGDFVKTGQKIGDIDTLMTVPTHSSVSGKVIAIEPRVFTDGSKIMSIVIENDFKDEVYENAITLPKDNKEDLTSEDIINIARQAGISGMGGAAFPTHVKMAAAAKCNIDYLIINGAECEPYITADHRAMIEYPRMILGGIDYLIKALKPKHTIIAIEDNKDDAISTIQTLTKGTAIHVKDLKTKYPQGGEKQLIKVLTGREIPPGKLILDVGCAVFNVDTCASLYRAIENKIPVIKRVVTVSGKSMKTPKNLLVNIGTPISELIDFCDGTLDDVCKYVVGGPMMGAAIYTLDVPVTKSTSAVLALSEKEYKKEDDAVCIRCGKCIDVCPVRLMPMYINMYSGKGNFDECQKYNVTDCIECGCCSYICPGRLHLVSSIRLAKAKVLERMKNNG